MSEYVLVSRVQQRLTFSETLLIANSFASLPRELQVNILAAFDYPLPILGKMNSVSKTWAKDFAPQAWKAAFEASPDLVTASERLIPPKQVEGATEVPEYWTTLYRYCHCYSKACCTRCTAQSEYYKSDYTYLCKDCRPEQYWWPMTKAMQEYLLAKEDLKYFSVQHKMSKNSINKRSISSTLAFNDIIRAAELKWGSLRALQQERSRRSKVRAAKKAQQATTAAAGEEEEETTQPSRRSKRLRDEESHKGAEEIEVVDEDEEPAEPKPKRAKRK